MFVLLPKRASLTLLCPASSCDNGGKPEMKAAKDVRSEGLVEFIESL